MKNIVTQIFVTLGVLFLVFLIFLSYFFIADPFGLKPLLFGSPASMQSSGVSNTDENTTNDTSDTSGGFELSSAQIEALVALGIDPSAVPSSISAEQEACFVGVLGEARVGEIKAGAVPSAFEFMKAKSCI